MNTCCGIINYTNLGQDHNDSSSLDECSMLISMYYYREILFYSQRVLVVGHSKMKCGICQSFTVVSLRRALTTLSERNKPNVSPLQ